MSKGRLASILLTMPMAVLTLATALALAESPAKAPSKGGNPAIQDGSTVQMEYTLTDDKGKVLDTNKGQDPLTYIQGDGQIIVGLEKALKGLHSGDQKHVVVPPEEGYGPFKPEAIIEIPKERIPPDAQKVGARLMGRAQNGPPTPLMVKEVKEKTVVLDANHPLAGKTLTFDVKILDVEPPRAR